MLRLQSRILLFVSKHTDLRFVALHTLLHGPGVQLLVPIRPRTMKLLQSGLYPKSSTQIVNNDGPLVQFN